MIGRSEWKYEPLVMGTFVNEYGYRIVTLNLWPGATLDVTMTEQGIGVDQAKEAAIALGANIMRLVRG